MNTSGDGPWAPCSVVADLLTSSRPTRVLLPSLPQPAGDKEVGDHEHPD